MSVFKRFARNERGNVALIFAIALIPLFGAAGAVIDYARASDARTKLANALDAGVLAVGSQPPMSDKEAFATVKDWVDTHLGSDFAGSWSLKSVTQDKEGRIIAAATGTVETTITNILGVSEIPIDVTSEVVRNIGKVEVVLVLDNTGSMQGTKISKLRDAAEALVDTLAVATPDPEDLKIGLVPFSQTVNVGSGYKNAAWLDADGESESAKSLFLGQEVNRFDLFEALDDEWAGCVETRNATYEATETVPAKGTPDTLYVPYFAPDEPGFAGEGDNGAGDLDYNNSYLDDRPIDDIKSLLDGLGLDALLDLPVFRLLQGDVVKYEGSPDPYEGTADTFNYDYGPNSGCEIAPLLRLTSDTAKAKAAIDKMIANGNTDIPIGATWGWNVLSDKGPFGDGVTYGTEDWTKIMVLMTDGNNENHVPDDDNENASYYSGIGYVWQERQGVPADNTSKSDRTKARDQRLGEICAAMKAKGIVIYTVRVEVRNGSSNVLEKCATTPDDFYDVDSVADLTRTFENIGGSIQKLRLAR